MNHLPQVIQQEAAELGLDLVSLTFSLDVSTRAEPPELVGKCLKAPVKALCPSLHYVTTALCPSRHNVTINVPLPTLCHPCCGRGYRHTIESAALGSSSSRRSQPRSTLEGTLRSGQSLSFTLGETEAQMREGLVQVRVTRGSCIITASASLHPISQQSPSLTWALYSSPQPSASPHQVSLSPSALTPPYAFHL